MITCLQDKVKESIRSFKSVEIKCGGLLLNLDSSCIEHYRVYSLCHHLAADISKGNEFLFVIDLTYTHLIVDLIYWTNLGRKLLGFFIKLIVALQGNIPTEMSYSADLVMVFEFFLQIQCWLLSRDEIAHVCVGIWQKNNQERKKEENSWLVLISILRWLPRKCLLFE